MKTDYLVIGAGLAGLNFALNVAAKDSAASVVILSRGGLLENNSARAQGGIAAVSDPGDRHDLHIKDTLTAGAFANQEESVQILVRESPERIKDLFSWGAQFDLNDQGLPELALEGGHSVSRILHVKDQTGKHLVQVLREKLKEHNNIKVLEGVSAEKLIVSDKGGKKICSGAVVVSYADNSESVIEARAVYLAAGGAGQVYSRSTNSPEADGSGIRLAAEAGAEVENIDMIQFHPTALYAPGHRLQLISEAVRGEGAEIINSRGEAFLYRYHKRGSLAPRDIVSRAIMNEVSGAENVFLDCTGINRFSRRFPYITDVLKELDIDPESQPVPVMPAAHYLCGGIKVDKWGATSISNLFAGGECASTGVHGANRLASNSLAEAMVFSYRSALYASENLSSDYSSGFRYTSYQISDLQAAGLEKTEQEIQSLMWNYAGVIKSFRGLEQAAKELGSLAENLKPYAEIISPQLSRVRSLHKTASLIIEQSLARKENKGVFFNIDLEKKPGQDFEGHSDGKFLYC